MKSERALWISMCTLAEQRKYPTATGKGEIDYGSNYGPLKKNVLITGLCSVINLSQSTRGCTLGLLTPDIDARASDNSQAI